MINRTLKKFNELQRELEMEGWQDDLIDDLVKLKNEYKKSQIRE